MGLVYLGIPSLQGYVTPAWAWANLPVKTQWWVEEILKKDASNVYECYNMLRVEHAVTIDCCGHKNLIPSALINLLLVNFTAFKVTFKVIKWFFGWGIPRLGLKRRNAAGASISTPSNRAQKKSSFSSWKHHCVSIVLWYDVFME